MVNDRPVTEDTVWSINQPKIRVERNRKLPVANSGEIFNHSG